VNAVRADNFHVLFDLGHWMSSVESHNALEPIRFGAIYPTVKSLSFSMARRRDQPLLPRPGRCQVWPIVPRCKSSSTRWRTSLRTRDLDWSSATDPADRSWNLPFNMMRKRGADGFPDAPLKRFRHRARSRRPPLWHRNDRRSFSGRPQSDLPSASQRWHTSTMVRRLIFGVR
jgi:hypothetical protein